MFKSTIAVAVVLCFAIMAVNAGLIETQHVIHEPVLTNVGTVVHSSPSAVSHQSLTQVHGKTVTHSVYAPAVKTSVHTASVPIVKTIHPVVHTYTSAAAAPVVHHIEHSAPLITVHH